MKFLVLGNLSGRTAVPGNVGSDGLSERAIYPLDIDELDAAICRIAPELNLELPDGQTIELGIRERDDFHPDFLYRKLDVFRELRDLRVQLHTPSTYPEATARLRQLMQNRCLPDADQHATQTPSDWSNEDDKATLERLLEKPLSSGRSGDNVTESAIARLIDQALDDVAVPAADPNRQLYFDAVDELIGERMRSILHHPRFQALEALWRSIQFLVERLELDEELQLYALDVTKEELLEDLDRAGKRSEHTEIFRLLVEHGVQIPGTEPWSLLVGNFRFGPSEQDVNLLSALGTIASQAGGPFLAQADSALLGCDSLRDSLDPRNWRTLETAAGRRWQALRESPAARWLGLALPRLLLRLPYGPDTDEIEAFSFSEILEPRQQHGCFLWGNPAFGCAFLIARAFKDAGRTAGVGASLEIDDLPAFSYRDNGESRLKPCAEALLPDGVADAMLAFGLIPVLSKRNSGTIRVLSMISLCHPVCGLAISPI